MKDQATQLSRRAFIGTTAAAAALAMTPNNLFAGGKPDSNFKGVQIGAITYSFRSMPGSADDLLKYLVTCGISSIELMGGPVEQFAGIPKENVREWRASVSMDKFKELRKIYNDAGVNIHIVKFGDIGPKVSEEEIHYYFQAAKALGAKGITTEISNDKAKFLGPIADEHKLMIGFHNHTKISADAYEKPFSYGKYLAMNLDVGHYVAGTNESPLPLIEKYAEQNRILSLHFKDRKVNNGPNMPFGLGDTPVALILHQMQRNKYDFPADIELEYDIPEGSDAVAEVKKCVEFCENALS
jgi:sugar phosphate isomerase/epimerase